MTSPPPFANQVPQQAAVILRTNSLALSFQEVITVILRTRFQTQRAQDSETFRASIRRMISQAVQEVRALGYTDETAQMSLYAIIGFLDESVLNSQDPTFADWSRRPLQEEMFGGHFAGELFFRHVEDLLNRPESHEVADALELHAVCLLLGYRGRFAFGDASEIHNILRRIRDKIVRIRGPFALFRPTAPPPVAKVSSGDKWVRTLAIAAVLLLVVTIAAFLGYLLLLKPSADLASQAVVFAPEIGPGFSPDITRIDKSGFSPRDTPSHLHPGVAL
jgi:type VI secretion system protein ImpK